MKQFVRGDPRSWSTTFTAKYTARVHLSAVERINVKVMLSTDKLQFPVKLIQDALYLKVNLKENSKAKNRHPDIKLLIPILMQQKTTKTKIKTFRKISLFYSRVLSSRTLREHPSV